jgi:hypothetical protein
MSPPRMPEPGGEACGPQKNRDSWPPGTQKPGNSSLALFPALLHCEAATAFGS